VDFTPQAHGEQQATLSASGSPGGTVNLALDGQGFGMWQLDGAIAGAGQGTISKVGGGIACFSDCTDVVPDGTTVTLQAKASLGSQFDGWSGPCSGTGDCVFTMNGPLTATASFSKIALPITATVNTVGGATGTISSSTGATDTHDYGDPVTLTAIPQVGFGFAGWSGDCEGMGICTIPADAAAAVTATFTPVNIAFVTSTTYIPKDIGSVANADAFCQAQATAAGLPGTYMAYLGTATEPADQRIQNSGKWPHGWVRTDGLPVTNMTATNATPVNLYANFDDYPLALDEFGTPVPDSVPFDTAAASPIGALWSYPNGTCLDWTSAQGDDLWMGRTSSLYWVAAGHDKATHFCATPHRLFCFGVDYATAVDVPKTTGRIAFVSATYFTPADASGLADADAVCAYDASRSSLPGTYKAMLGTVGVSAASRFDLTGAPWVRVDGIRWMNSASDLADPSFQPLTPLIPPTYPGQQNEGWTGGLPGVAPTDPQETCLDWQGGMYDEGLIGDVYDTYVWASWSDGWFHGCSTARPVYCLQE
jgi:hypothetical protein